MGKREKKEKKSAKSDVMEQLEEEEEEESAEVKIKIKKSKRMRSKRRKEEDDADDDDDDEANEDLISKIVEKAMLRKCSAENGEAVIVTGLKGEKKEKIKKKKKKKEKDIENLEDPVDGTKEENVDSIDMNVVDNAAEKNPIEMSNGVVLQRLLRGPRYFDPPDSSWGACYNCGEEGHTTVNCTSAKRKKPCFVCGSFDHNSKQCAKGKECFICKKGGHRAKDCPEKDQGRSESSRMCLKCGDSGHDMFSCWNNYSADDLKEIQCYICKNFGHLCCASYPDGGPSEISCYRCGLLGHTGLACAGSRGETSGTLHLSSCFRCGEEGHFARECTNSNVVNKWNRELSTPKKKVFKERKEKYEFRSAPHDFGKATKKNAQYGGGYASGYNTKQRARWIIDDPEDFPRSNGWRSPSTPGNKRAMISNYGDHSSISYSSRKSNRLDYSDSASYESVKYHHHHRFSASRFGNSSHDGRRNYEW